MLAAGAVSVEGADVFDPHACRKIIAEVTARLFAAIKRLTLFK
jgi:hypothetical protein